MAIERHGWRQTNHQCDQNDGTASAMG